MSAKKSANKSSGRRAKSKAKTTSRSGEKSAKPSKTSKKHAVIEHELIPEHSKLSKKDAEELFEKYNITLKELPKILVSDPAIAHLDVEVGDVIMIKRRSRTAGETVFYRGVVKK